MKKAKSILATTMISGVLSLQSAIGNAQGDSHINLKYSEAIVPFKKINISNADLKDLRKRILETKWPEKETVIDESQGVQLATIKKLTSVE